MRVVLFLITFFLILGFAGCEAHDYWALPGSIIVNSEDNVLKANGGESVSQDLFVRYQVDYTLENLSEDHASEVVVMATSYVNNFVRAKGYRVWHLDPSQQVEGILTTNELQLGNRLDLSLMCCSESMCSSREVICPTEDLVRPGVEIAGFCYDSCMEDDSCASSCPSENACEEICRHGDNLNWFEYEECRLKLCGSPYSDYSCSYECLNDPSCMETCRPAEECVEGYCQRQKASCFRNCLSTYYRCNGVVFEADTDIIPCSLCGGEGACFVNTELRSLDSLSIWSVDGNTEYSCVSECREYPAACVNGCESLYDDRDSRINCLDACLRQHLRWCNDNIVPEGYIDSLSHQPCCYGAYCHAGLNGVVKSYDVKCFNDTDCGSGRKCSNEGICVKTDSSSCSALLHRHSSFPIWVVLFGLCFGVVLRRRTRHD